MTASWFAGDSARLVGERLLTFQAPNGGWSKHVDVLPHARRPGESYFGESEAWTWISTLDNGSTVSQLQFLAALDGAQPDPRWRAAYLRGIGYLLDAQFPGGCWPQVWPLQGGYHDAITFNDDASVNVATLLRGVGRGEVAFVPDSVRARAATAARAAVDCFVATQVVQRGTRTIWGQQHHPLTLEPVAARSYEHASLSSQESAAILRFLMDVPDPSPAVARAVHAGAAWLRAHALRDIAYTFDGGLRQAPGAGPVWARMYELGTDRPLFSNRDGIRRYDWNELTDRRQGYGWYSYAPVAALEGYDRWRAQHPRPIPRAKERTQTP
jgi:PelA/Pel-15E family pectate lyase